MSIERIKIEGLEAWSEYDDACYAIGRALGVLPKRAESLPGMRGLFYTSNLISNGLFAILEKLVEMGYVLYDKEKELYKVNDEFDILN